MMVMMMIMKYDNNNKIRAHARPARAPARAIAHAHAARSTTHARTPAPPPAAAPRPPRAARPHRTKVLDRVLPVSACTALFLSLSLYGLRVRTVHHPTRKGWKGAYVLVLRGTTTSTPSGGKPLSPPSPFFLAAVCCLRAAHTDILVPLPRTDILVSLGLTFASFDVRVFFALMRM